MCLKYNENTHLNLNSYVIFIPLGGQIRVRSARFISGHCRLWMPGILGAPQARRDHT